MGNGCRKAGRLTLPARQSTLPGRAALLHRRRAHGWGLWQLHFRQGCAGAGGRSGRPRAALYRRGSRGHGRRRWGGVDRCWRLGSGLGGGSQGTEQQHKESGHRQWRSSRCWGPAHASAAASCRQAPRLAAVLAATGPPLDNRAFSSRGWPWRTSDTVALGCTTPSLPRT
jgi:hypothetical protein